MAADMGPRPDMAIEMRNVCVRRGEIHILRDVDWSLPAGSRCVVLGPNGSGKTTLMRVVTGFMWPSEGTVDILGQRLGHTDVRQLRKRVGVVDPGEQYGVDNDLSALDAVLTGYFGTIGLYETPSAEQRDHAEHLLDCVGMTHRKSHRLGLLSTGEKRRCLMARALAHLPELLILDEPTAGLDISGRERILATLDRLQLLRPELTIIMVTHHVEEISPRTDQVVLLREGRIAACGRPQAVINPESLTAAFGCKVFVQKRSGRWWLEVLPEAWLDLLKES